MVKGKENGCPQECDEKESKRSEKTKGSITLEQSFAGPARKAGGACGLRFRPAVSRA